MRLSLIVTTFRRPELLVRTLRSVIAQLDGTLEIELIVSDDDPAGSGEEGVRKAGVADVPALHLSYLLRDTGAGGVAASRNRAIAASRGEWLMLLDDDDALRPGAVRALLARADESGADFVRGLHVHVHEQVGSGAIRELPPPHAWTGPEQLLVRNVVPIGSFIIRRSALRVSFNTRLKTHEDWLFLLDNLVAPDPPPRIVSVDRVVLAVHQSLDDAHSHRTFASGHRQHAADLARIYAMYPAPHLMTERRRRLARLPLIDLDTLMSGSTQAPGPVMTSVGQGRFITLDGKGSLKAGMPGFTEADTEATRLAWRALQDRIGTVVDVGAGKGVFAIPVARLYPHRRILCVEPVLDTFMHLCANLLANGLGKAEPRRARVAGVCSAESTDCPQLSLDRLVDAGHEPVALVRIAVSEGLQEILEGGASLLQARRPLLLLPRLRGPDAAMSAADAWLARRGYRVMDFTRNRLAWHRDDPSAAELVRALQSLGGAQLQGRAGD